MSVVTLPDSVVYHVHTSDKRLRDGIMRELIRRLDPFQRID